MLIIFIPKYNTPLNVQWSLLLVHEYIIFVRTLLVDSIICDIIWCLVVYDTIGPKYAKAASADFPTPHTKLDTLWMNAQCFNLFPLATQAMDNLWKNTWCQRDTFLSFSFLRFGTPRHSHTLCQQSRNTSGACEMKVSMSAIPPMGCEWSLNSVNTDSTATQQHLLMVSKSLMTESFQERFLSYFFSAFCNLPTCCVEINALWCRYELYSARQDWMSPSNWL